MSQMNHLKLGPAAVHPVPAVLPLPTVTAQTNLGSTPPASRQAQNTVSSPEPLLQLPALEKTAPSRNCKDQLDPSPMTAARSPSAAFPANNQRCQTWNTSESKLLQSHSPSVAAWFEPAFVRVRTAFLTHVCPAIGCRIEADQLDSCLVSTDAPYLASCSRVFGDVPEVRRVWRSAGQRQSRCEPYTIDHLQGRPSA